MTHAFRVKNYCAWFSYDFTSYLEKNESHPFQPVVTTTFLRPFFTFALAAAIVLRVDLAREQPGFTLGAPASAATVMLSDNLSATTEDVELVSADRFVSSSFSTGGQSAVTLDSITLRMRMDLPGQAQLDLYSDRPGTPGTPDTHIASLTSPSSFSYTLSDHIFSGNNLSLSPNTIYWAVLSAINGDFSWAWTRALTGSGDGFQGTWGFSDTAGASWNTFDTEAMQMQVTAEAVPGPLPLAGAFPALAFSRRLRRRIQGASHHRQP